VHVSKSLIKYLTIILLIIGGCTADFYTKKWAESNLKGKPSVTVIKGVLELGFAENRGMVFGILNSRMPMFARNVLVVLRILILGFLTVYIILNRHRSFLFHLPFLLFWAGAVGNLIDPFIYGYVVDFIHLRLGTILDWPFLFNLADAYVTVGIGLLLVTGMRRPGKVEVEKNKNL
jgi:signal peptidase II